MVDYVKIAKDIADKRKSDEAAARKKAQEEREQRDKEEKELMSLLKKELKQWDGVGEFTVKDLSDKSWVECAQVDKGKDRCVGFKVHWDSWESQWSDDCTTTDSGHVIEMTFYMEERYDTWRNVRSGDMKSVIRYGYNQHMVEECMKNLASYLSKFL